MAAVLSLVAAVLSLVAVVAEGRHYSLVAVVAEGRHVERQPSQYSMRIGPHKSCPL